MKNVKVLDIGHEMEKEDDRRVELPSGRQLSIDSDRDEDIIQIREKNGKMTIRMRLTGEGALIDVEGGCLQMRSLDTITMHGRRVDIHADEETTIKSGGNLQVESKDEMEIDSGEDLRITGKMIHIN